ncbi:uncharacterized protein PG998_003399 [Apiospora kogelbergensis]|uniref:uncharacterized protein n=1 Tax=Apiospora kogelbergensis TaxID=1337665 RepID=UPI00312FC151
MDAAAKGKGVVIFGGGTATNSLVDIFNDLRESRACTLSYVIPISDNGGSSSELIRVFGGPGIGDIRSRLVRLIPAGPEGNADLAATKALFNYRLSSEPNAARSEWLDIVEGRHAIWTDVSSEKKELIRPFFNHVNMEIVKRARPSSTFNFGRAAVGNLFLTGARIFLGSLESAIYLLSQICAIPPQTLVLPAINTSFTHHISAGLADKTVITGQNAISHPSAPTSLPDNALLTAANQQAEETDDHDLIEDANLPGSLPTLRKQYIEFSKSGEEDLPSRIERVWYINPYGHEIRPRANPKVLDAVAGAGAVIYSIGSLYTSLVPSLILRGVGAAVAARPRGVVKVLILNSSLDRETGPSSNPFSAVGFVRAIVRALQESQEAGDVRQERGGEEDGNSMRADEVRKYVTHLIHLDGEGTPKVDRDELASLGVEPVRVYGRRVDGMLRYDEGGLVRAIEAVIGTGRETMGRSRRNTKQ